jgi:protein-S-isoprenylcysteine O-methyltransferase Ste14
MSKSDSQYWRHLLMKETPRKSLVTAVAAQGSILVFVIMGLEVMIMISPFAFFFYSVFSPVFNVLDQHPATAWLTAFFLPHMILPPTLVLRIVRVTGSVLFVAGAVAFLICALQVYLGKIFKWGIAQRGAYRVIRHPQYLALAFWGVGMVILWPRFVVLVSLSIMLVLYYYLARDEERRMLAKYGESYATYMSSTGMFLPRFLERLVPGRVHVLANKRWWHVAFPIFTLVFVVGAGFVSREITVSSLPFETADNISLLSMLPEDQAIGGVLARDIVAEHSDSALAFLKPDRSYLGYVMPPDYIMQGMIANTGSQYHLFKQHNTIALITDWVLNPFEHLRRSPMAHMAQMHGVDPAVARRHHCPLGLDDATLDCSSCPYRRVIIVEVDGKAGEQLSGKATLSVGAARVPVAYLDINTTTGEILNSKRVEAVTAWAGIPTPAI